LTTPLRDFRIDAGNWSTVSQKALKQECRAIALTDLFKMRCEVSQGPGIDEGFSHGDGNCKTIPSAGSSAQLVNDDHSLLVKVPCLCQHQRSIKKHTITLPRLTQG
jgi:hypothetical protein